MLNLSPSYSEVIISPEENEYAKLINCPMHNSSNLISLADVIYNCQNNTDGLNINLLVAVKDVSIIFLNRFNIQINEFYCDSHIFIYRSASLWKRSLWSSTLLNLNEDNFLTSFKLFPETIIFCL